MTGAQTARLLVPAALALAVAVVAAVLLSDAGATTLRAQFRNADGLVRGGPVEVAGRKVGKTCKGCHDNYQKPL